MKLFTIMVAGRATEVIPEFNADGVALAERYHPDFVAQLVEYDPDAPPVEPEIAPAPVWSVTMRQARLALLAAGKLATVNSAIAALPSPQEDAAQIEWEFASTVDRGSKIVALMAGALGLDEQALDSLFLAASKL